MLSAIPTATAQTQIGEPIKAMGTVSLERGSDARAIEVSEPLFPADVIGTGSRSYARLGFTAGWSIDMPAMSIANIAWSPNPDTIYLEVGALRGVSSPGASRLTVVSGKAIAVASGTTFHLSAAPTGAASLYVEHGTVTFSNFAGASVTVSPGLASTVSAAGGGPSLPAPPSPALQQEAVALSTLAALELGPEGLPREHLARLRDLRRPASEAVRRTPSAPASPRSIEIPTPKQTPGIVPAITGTVATLLVIPALVIDGASSTTTLGTR